MNLKLVFRIFAGFGAFFALMSLLATDAMMESYGMELSSDSSLLIQFMVMVQLMFAIVVWQLPSWLGENLAKAGPTLMVVSLTCRYEYFSCGHRCLTGFRGPNCGVRSLGGFRRAVLFLQQKILVNKGKYWLL